MTCCFRAWSASSVHWRSKEVACYRYRYRYRNTTSGYRERDKMSCRRSEGKEGQ